MKKKKKKKSKNRKVEMMKSPDLRVYKDNARPTVYVDKKHKKKPKHKKKWEDDYE